MYIYIYIYIYLYLFIFIYNLSYYRNIVNRNSSNIAVEYAAKEKYIEISIL